MKPLLYERKGNVVYDVNDKTKSTRHRAVNEAKKKSRELQMYNDGALGRGSVRVFK